MRPPDEIKDLCRALLRGLNTVLGGKLHGVYIHGAAAFPDSGPTGDIDFHVVLRETLTSEESHKLKDLHATLAREFPPLGAELDGYYVLLDEAAGTSPPRHQLLPDVTDSSWALHREHMRAGRCIVLHGPDPKAVFCPASWPELAAALQRELEYVQDHLAQYPDYCILNLCRLMCSFDTQDVVVSKAAAAAWAYEAFPEWRRHIDTAKKSYAGQATAQDKEFMRSEVGGLLRFAWERIRRGLGKSSPGQSLPGTR
ncbi:MAG: aminoglycoside adenylyltransferase domain-containing protein [Armatimonadota bacterium]